MWLGKRAGLAAAGGGRAGLDRELFHIAGVIFPTRLALTDPKSELLSQSFPGQGRPRVSAAL
jgi:hypothetical protein